MANKRDLTEADIRSKYITPALTAAGWDLHKQIREEQYFTDGRIRVLIMSKNYINYTCSHFANFFVA